MVEWNLGDMHVEPAPSALLTWIHVRMIACLQQGLFMLLIIF